MKHLLLGSFLLPTAVLLSYDDLFWQWRQSVLFFKKKQGRHAMKVIQKLYLFDPEYIRSTFTRTIECNGIKMITIKKGLFQLIYKILNKTAKIAKTTLVSRILEHFS